MRQSNDESEVACGSATGDVFSLEPNGRGNGGRAQSARSGINPDPGADPGIVGGTAPSLSYCGKACQSRDAHHRAAYRPTPTPNPYSALPPRQFFQSVQNWRQG